MHAELLGNRYRVLDRVGQGAVGEVYRALDIRRHETVALKCVDSNDHLRRGRLECEAGLLSRLRHPAIPRATRSFVDGDRRVLVMHFVSGADLAERLARRGRPFPVLTVLDWADQVLDVLSYLHARGVVHHDIKPANLKLDAAGRVVVLDFGLASAGLAAGYTASYAPPEQVHGGPTSPRTDLYALGATLYELLARRSPPSAVDRLQADRLPGLASLNSSIPADVAATVSHALALDADERPASATAMRQALRQASASCPAAEPPAARDVSGPHVAESREPTLEHKRGAPTGRA
jgi:serine/threonine protein kinase